MQRASLASDQEYEQLRLVHRVLHLFYQDGISQAEIARTLGLSTSKVSRLLARARDEGMVEFTFRLPYEDCFALGDRLEAAYGLQAALVLPTVAPHEPAMVEAVGRAGAHVLLQRIRDGDLIALSGGRTLHALVLAVRARRRYNVRVVPMMGGIQGSGTLDVNYLALELAERLGGTAYQLHAPLSVETVAQKEQLIAMGPVKEILDLARQATVAVVGIGTVGYNGLYGAASAALARAGHAPVILPAGLQELVDHYGDLGQIAARIYTPAGQPCAEPWDSLVVGLALDEIRQIPVCIGVAAGAVKAAGIHGALQAGYVKALVTDEAAASAVVGQGSRMP